MAEHTKVTLETVTREGVFVDGQKISDDFLSRIKRPELDLLLGMLDGLALTRADMDKLTPDSPYVQSLPASFQHSISILQEAIAAPDRTRDIVQAEIAVNKSFDLAEIKKAYSAFDDEEAIKERQDRIDSFTKEFTGIVAGLTGDQKVASHSALNGALKAYGKIEDPQADETKIADYKKGLANRMRSSGYSFFILRDKETGAPVALASGNASKLGTADNDKTTFRLLNMAVPVDHQGQGYGTQLIEAVRAYAQDNHYEKMVMPLSMHAIAKENPVRYAGMLQNLNMATPEMGDHPADPLSIEFHMSPVRKMEKKVDGPRQSWANGVS